MVECPECGDEYTNLGQHWHFSPPHRPQLTEKQLEIITGIVMGDGQVDNSNKNSYIKLDMISPNYLKYLDSVFGCLGCDISLTRTAAESAKKNRDNGFSPNAKKENYSDLYRWLTRSHPKFNEFREWYSTGEKVWPKDIELTPTVLKHCYVGDGHYEEEKNRLSIAMDNEVKNTEKISQYFTNMGLPEPSNYNIYKRKNGNKKCGAEWGVEESKKLFEHMGKPLPDFEYKWPEKYR